MPFLKLDTGILNSTLWVDRECREIFLTALLMAEPFEVVAPLPQIEVRSLEHTGFMVPIGWYGRVSAAGVGIVRRALVDEEAGMAALERLGAPDLESRSQDYEGRRLVRVDGGFIALNFMKYRDRDHSAAERSKRYRDRQKKLADTATRDEHRATRDDTPEERNVTQADADAQAEVRDRSSSSAVERLMASLPSTADRQSWRAEIAAAEQGAHGKPLTPAQIELACRDYLGNGHAGEKPSLRHFRAFLISSGLPPKPKVEGKITAGRAALKAGLEKYGATNGQP